MARNERAGNCWSQPRRSTPVKSRSGCSRGLGAGDLDELGDIMNVLSCSERQKRGQANKSVSNSGSYSASDCCLKNGRVQCSCLWPKSTYPEQRKNSHCFSKSFNKSLPYENKSSRWPDNDISNEFCQNNKMLEEFILDDNELCLLNYYDIPVDVPKRHHVRNTGKVKTVSIIDTLSELASGATDREDEGGFSSAVSESAVLNRYLYRPKARHVRQSMPRRDRGLRSNYIPTPSTSKLPVDNSKCTNRSTLFTPVRTQNEVSRDFHSQNFVDDGNFSCSSLKRTLKYLRKAVSSNVVEEETRSRRPVRENCEQDDAFRLCFSDSEVKDAPEHWVPFRSNRTEFPPRSKSKSLLTVLDPFTSQPPKPKPLFRSRTKSVVPEWIQEVFASAKKGDVEKMKQSLKEIDPALVRNLSDDHGNNLWHICAVHDNFECLNWLCTHNKHHADALKDENKNGFSPVALAVKHGSLLAVQWLIHNTVSKCQLLPQADSRSLLHVAARYGQYAIVEWLLGYMSSQDLDASIVDSEGNTALHLASKYGHIACVKALIFHIGSLKTRNERGLKPLDLAVKHSRNDCADYLIAMESSYNLAALNLRQHSEIQQLQKENAEIKSYFKELLTLTKRLQHRQKELVQSFTRLNLSSQLCLDSTDRVTDKCNRYLDDYSQLLSTVMTDEEHHLLMVEDRWKKSKRQTKLPENRKKPLDVLRSQYSHVLDKVICQSPPIPSTPETSDGSWQSGDDECIPIEKPFPDFSAPDVVNSLSPQTSVPYLDTRRKLHSDCNNTTSGVNNELDLKCNTVHEQSVLNVTSSSVLSKQLTNSRDVNLRMFFKQNPNLRQSGETCSVLEVLEPSSSDSEECSNHKKRLAKCYLSEKETEQSSSSSAVETLSPYSCRPSSSGSKASESHSNSSGSRKNRIPKSNNVQNDNASSASERTKAAEDTQDSPNEVGDKTPNDQLSKSNNFSSEPDLIKGTQKKKSPTLNAVADKEKKSKDNSFDNVVTDNPSISTEDSESLDADHSFSSANEVPDTLVSSHINSEPSSNNTTVKKKSFLLKFALRGRWPSKISPRSLKNEISPEEFRETYSRSTSADPALPASQLVTLSECPKKNLLQFKNDVENSVLDSADKDSTNNEAAHDGGHFSHTTPKDQGPVCTRRGLLPPRRDPPPAPPFNIRDDEQSQDHSDDDMSVNIQKSSISSFVEDCITPSESLQNSYLGSGSSDLWNSSDSKSLFRPASSASRVDSLSRGEENFSLNKSSSASTEMLSALDSSIAGRQSPAPSEVSKTESALSPPSDVSKTESTRYLSQLGRIEESGHLNAMKVSNLQNKDEQNIKESSLLKEVKTETKQKKKQSAKKLNSDKPWYEFSDEEDVIVPQRYKAVSVSMRSSSEDEAVTG